jgi:hypothetical protein
MLTGQDIWRLGEAANLRGTLSSKFAVYPDLLEQAGYWVGFTGKGCGGESITAGGRKRDPAGPRFASFQEFIAQKPPGEPFCFWYGDQFKPSGGQPSKKELCPVCTPAKVVREGVRLEDFRIPAFLPDCQAVRDDFYQYFQRLRNLDAAAGDLLAQLEKLGQIDNTLIVMAADNGMEFPRGYPNLYDSGTREFLAVRWGHRVRGGRAADDFVNLIDLAPTFLEAAGLDVPASMTGRSLMKILDSTRSGFIDPARRRVITARERHAPFVRQDNLGYPMRAIRTEHYLYIRNYEPDRWPAGDPDVIGPAEGIYGDIDTSATKWFMYEHRNDPKIQPLFELSFGKRPAEELFELRDDPEQLRNVAGKAEYKNAKSSMADELERYLRKMGDPRALGKPAPWDRYPVY